MANRLIEENPWGKIWPPTGKDPGHRGDFRRREWGASRGRGHEDASAVRYFSIGEAWGATLAVLVRTRARDPRTWTSTHTRGTLCE